MTNVIVLLMVAVGINIIQARVIRQLKGVIAERDYEISRINSEKGCE